MALIPLGFLAASGAAAAGDFMLLDQRVLTGTQSSVTFSNLGQYAGIYRHLQVRLVAKDNRGNAASSGLFLTINGSATNYRWHVLGGNGSSVITYDGFSTNNIAFEGATGNPATNNFGVAVIDLLDAYEAKNKTVRAFIGQLVPGYNLVQLQSGGWFDTAALSSITFTGRFADLLAGSRFSLYGVK